MLNTLIKVDPGILSIPSGNGHIMVSNALQGRIFAEIDGVLLHRLVKDLAENPSPVEFNNLGGNSLWPGPEGGDFAFNYPPNGSWYVQDGINRVPTATVSCTDSEIKVAKEIELVNRKGKTVRLKMQRHVRGLSAAELPEAKWNLRTAGYTSIDEWIPLDEISTNDALLCAWSLEQFPGAEGIIGFGKCRNTDNCLNDDFYGSVAERTSYTENSWIFHLGGPKRLQIGVKANSDPELIGAFDAARKMLVLRYTTLPGSGKYINIADNDQATGPYGAADAYSIFNGSQELDFHELETISPMQVTCDGKLATSKLVSKTIFATADDNALLLDYLKNTTGIIL